MQKGLPGDPLWFLDLKGHIKEEGFREYIYTKVQRPVDFRIKPPSKEARQQPNVVSFTAVIAGVQNWQVRPVFKLGSCVVMIHGLFMS